CRFTPVAGGTTPHDPRTDSSDRLRAGGGDPVLRARRRRRHLRPRVVTVGALGGGGPRGGDLLPGGRPAPARHAGEHSAAAARVPAVDGRDRRAGGCEYR